MDLGPPKGRGVISEESIKKGQYVCEYRTYRVYPVGSVQEAQLAAEYDQNAEGSYILTTAYAVPQFGARLCFDATRRFKDIGRLINHSAKGANLKPGPPVHARGKWRVGLLAIKDIKPGEEVSYDYNVRSEKWMKKKTEENSGEVRQSEKIGQESEKIGQESEKIGQESENIGQESEKIGPGEERSVARVKRPKYKRRLYWCPVTDCPAGPVQKMTQHLKKANKMDSTTAFRMNKLKRRAPLEAARTKTPNPHTRSSHQRPLEIFAKPPPVAAAVEKPKSTPKDLQDLSKFHHGVKFLEDFKDHLLSPAGGNRGERSATQIARYVSKYLYYLNSTIVDEDRLLETQPILEYLKCCRQAGIMASGVLHRILAHKLAVQYMTVEVSCI